MPSYAEKATEFAQSITVHPARLAKSTSNLFRNRCARNRGLNAESLTNIIQVNADQEWVDVEAMTPYDELVKATLKHDALPCVVPQLKSITIGGAISGIGIESSSFRYGLVHETALELDVALSTGELICCTPDNEHADLFFGFPNSYGTLGYATRVRARTVPSGPFVKLQHQRFENFDNLLHTLKESTESDVDFVDGVIFNKDCMVLTTARFTDHAEKTSDYTERDIYYRSLLSRDTDCLTADAYIWRWDTDWFWCSKNLGAQNPVIRRLLGKKRLNSRFYTRVMRWNNRWKALERLESLAGLRRESVIQDIDIPIENALDFFEFFTTEIGILPIWICPVRQRSDKVAQYPLYPMQPNKIYINFGFWDVLRFREKHPAGHFNRRIESVVQQLNGIKSLYSTSYFSEREFWDTYGGDQYRKLKSKYDPESRFPDIYEKCVRGK